MKNTFIEELKKYERKALDAKLIRSCSSKGQCTTNLRDLMGQVTALKERMAQYRPLLSDDIIVAFESLLWDSFNLYTYRFLPTRNINVIKLEILIKNLIVLFHNSLSLIWTLFILINSKRVIIWNSKLTFYKKCQDHQKRHIIRCQKRSPSSPRLSSTYIQKTRRTLSTRLLLRTHMKKKWR